MFRFRLATMSRYRDLFVCSKDRPFRRPASKPTTSSHGCRLGRAILILTMTIEDCFDAHLSDPMKTTRILAMGGCTATSSWATSSRSRCTKRQNFECDNEIASGRDLLASLAGSPCVQLPCRRRFDRLRPSITRSRPRFCFARLLIGSNSSQR